jgi:SAM-dependent methyltransferase
MPVDTIAEMLAAKDDLIYQSDAVGEQGERDPNNLRPEPVRIEGWPADRWQALVFLARPGGRLLEIGCGVGQLLATLAPHFDEVVGTELSPIRAERARYALAHLPNCRIFNAPLESLADTLDPPYDCIIWADVLEHIIDVIGAMHILADLSRPGTQLVTVTDNIAFLPQRLNLLRGRAPTTAWAVYPNEGFAEDPTETILLDLGHVHYLTFRQVEILYRLAGFRPERRLGIGRSFGRLRNLWPTLLSGQVCVSGTFQGKMP